MPQSRVFTKRPESPRADVLKEFETFEVAWLADSLGYGLMDTGISPVWDLQHRIAGTAVTVRTPPGDFSLVPWALNAAQDGDILVIDTRGASHRAVWGDQFSGWASAVGIVAVIIDGATRDTTGIRDLKYPVFARTHTSRGPTMVGQGGDVNVPVVCGGVVVAPGDIIVADREGIVVVARRDLDYALERGRASHDYQVPEQSKETWPAYFEHFKDRGDPIVAETTWDA